MSIELVVVVVVVIIVVAAAVVAALSTVVVVRRRRVQLLQDVPAQGEERHMPRLRPGGRQAGRHRPWAACTDRTPDLNWRDTGALEVVIRHGSMSAMPIAPACSFSASCCIKATVASVERAPPSRQADESRLGV